MLWYDGSIPQAIVEAKRTQKIFLVVLDGQNDQSQKMLGTYADPEVETTLAGSCLAIKLLSDSEQFRQFSQIYPVAQVPSSFFIGSNGKPLDVLPGTLEKEAFLAKFAGILQAHHGDGATATKTEAPKSEQPPAEAASTSQTAEISPPASPSLSLEEKVQRAKQLLEKQKEQQKKDELEREREAEKQRRRQAHELAKAQVVRANREYEELAREVAREREEAKQARERIMQQIAQTRAEKKAAEQQMRGEIRHRETAAAPMPAPQQPIDSAITRIQFRLPEGAVITHQFPTDGKLRALHDFVQQEVRPEFGSFALATPYPRHQFTQDQMDISLGDLFLAPSSTILILPAPTVTSQAVTAAQGSMTQVIWFVLLPFINLWNYLSGWLFGGRPPPAPSPSSTAPPSPQQQPRQGQSPQASAAIRRQGNVFRLTNQDDNDEDDNNTWNGNSTQQM